MKRARGGYGLQNVPAGNGLAPGPLCRGPGFGNDAEGVPCPWPRS